MSRLSNACACGCSGGVCLQAAGYGKVVSHVVIGLKTVKGTKQLKLDPTIYDSLQKERVQVRLARVVIACRISHAGGAAAPCACWCGRH
jgi:hypothetical protein